MYIQADKVMFEIYQEATYERGYRVIYYTDLGDHNRDSEINRALTGRHVTSGYIKNFRKDEAKQLIKDFVERLNRGEVVEPDELHTALQPFAAPA